MEAELFDEQDVQIIRVQSLQADILNKVPTIQHKTSNLKVTRIAQQPERQNDANDSRKN